MIYSLFRIELLQLEFLLFFWHILSLKMQTFKDRVKHNHHQRSISFCNYDEFRRHDSTLPETEFRQRRPLLDTQPSVDPSVPIDTNANVECTEMSQINTDYENYGNFKEQLSQSDTEKNLIPEMSCLMPDQSKAAAPLAPSSTLNASALTSQVKGHRRSLSLRQRFEVGYDYIVSEFEQARVVAEKTVIVASNTVWKVCHFENLPNWMQDNEFLHRGHRPPLPSLWECAKSIFRVHTETGIY